MNRRKIYLACPYSDDSPLIRNDRFLAANAAAAALINEGHLVFSPISHSHSIAVCHNLPRSFEFWESFDRWMLGACDEVVVLMLPGWKESAGVQAEIKIATELGKPVSFM